MSLQERQLQWHSGLFGREGVVVNELAHLITAVAWGLVALSLAAGIPFAWRKVLAYIEAKTQLQLAEAVRRMLDD